MYLAVDVHFRPDMSTEGVERPRTTMTVKAALVIHLVLNGDLLGLVDGTAASRTALLILGSDLRGVRVYFRAFIRTGLLLTGPAVKLAGVNTNRVRIEFSRARRALETFLMETFSI